MALISNNYELFSCVGVSGLSASSSMSIYLQCFLDYHCKNSLEASLLASLTAKYPSRLLLHASWHLSSHFGFNISSRLAGEPPEQTNSQVQFEPTFIFNNQLVLEVNLYAKQWRLSKLSHQRASSPWIFPFFSLNKVWATDNQGNMQGFNSWYDSTFSWSLF